MANESGTTPTTTRDLPERTKGPHSHGPKAASTSTSPKMPLPQWPRLLPSLTDDSSPLMKKLWSPKNILYRVGSTMVISLIGSVGRFWTRVLNTTEVLNERVLLAAIDENYNHRKSFWRRQRTTKPTPLITIANHASCADDPLLWGALMPVWRHCNTTRARWSAAAQEVCFTNSLFGNFFSLGKTFPIIRGRGVHQFGMDYSQELLARGEWLHFFPEGKVIFDEERGCSVCDLEANQAADPATVRRTNYDGYNLKWGLARLVLEHFRRDPDGDLLVLPFAHSGMEAILPIENDVSNSVPGSGHHLVIVVRPGGPIHLTADWIREHFHDKILKCSDGGTCDLRAVRSAIMDFFDREIDVLHAQAVAIRESRAQLRKLVQPEVVKPILESKSHRSPSTSLPSPSGIILDCNKVVERIIIKQQTN